jgi:hypothetical protein
VVKMKNPALHTTVHKKLYERLVKDAKAANVSMSGYICSILEQHYKFKRPDDEVTSRRAFSYDK